MRVVLAVLTLFGTAIGVIQVAAPAFMAERGAPEAGGLLLAALSAGSLIGGIVYGARTWPGSLRRQLAVLMAGLAAAYCLLALAGVPAVLAALLGLAGLLLAPTTVVGSTLLDRVAPPGTATEAFTVMVMGIVAGTAVGNALGGAIVEGAAFEAAVALRGRRGRRRRADRAQDSVMRIWRMTIGCSGFSSGPTSATPILSTTSWPFVTLPSSA